MHSTAHSLSPQIDMRRPGLTLFNNLDEFSEIEQPLTLERTLLMVCVRGEITASIDLVRHSMPPGSMVVLRRGRIINNISRSHDFRGFMITIEDEHLESIIPLSAIYIASCYVHFRDNTVIPITPEQLQNLELMKSLLGQQNDERDIQPYRTQIFNSMVETLFYQVLGIYTVAMNSNNRMPSRREELLARFISLIDQYYRTERSVTFYARELCLSPKHLSSVVKSVSGLTASDWIDRKIIHEAKIMLRSTPKTIQQISQELNFPNQSFFGKFFKHLTDMTPREFRAQPEG